MVLKARIFPFERQGDRLLFGKRQNAFPWLLHTTIFFDSNMPSQYCLSQRVLRRVLPGNNTCTSYGTTFCTNVAGLHTWYSSHKTSNWSNSKSYPNEQKKENSNRLNIMGVQWSGDIRNQDNVLINREALSSGAIVPRIMRCDNGEVLRDSDYIETRSSNFYRVYLEMDPVPQGATYRLCFDLGKKHQIDDSSREQGFFHLKGLWCDSRCYDPTEAGYDGSGFLAD